jgi:2-dehydropantoate 2-reductase
LFFLLFFQALSLTTHMKVSIIGPGALGCLLASTLSLKAPTENKPEIWILDHRPERAQQLAANGLVLEEHNRKLPCRINATADPQKIGTADVIFLCVKSPKVADGLQAAKSIAGPDTLLVTLQNGIGHLEILETHTGAPSITIGVTAQGANMVDTGHVRHAGNGITRLGMLTDKTDRENVILNKTCNLLNEAGIETELVENIIDFVWAKLFVNVGINALTAIHDCPNGQLPESPVTKKQLADAVREAETVARARGIKTLTDPVAVTLEVCQKTSNNISSMLQDVRNRRPTEIDSINGAIVQIAKKLNIPVPVNDDLVHRVKKIEKDYYIG